LGDKLSFRAVSYFNENHFYTAHWNQGVCFGIKGDRTRWRNITGTNKEHIGKKGKLQAGNKFDF